MPLSSQKTRCSGVEFKNKIKGGGVPREYIPAVRKGVEGASGAGAAAGYPMIDFAVTLLDGHYHEVDSSALAFEIAARGAFQAAASRAGPQLLEPMMRVEVVTSENYVGDVIGDLSARRGRVTGHEARGGSHVINAMVPLGTMFGYVNSLRSMTQGRATFTMHFDHYAPVPDMVSEEVRVNLA